MTCDNKNRNGFHSNCDSPLCYFNGELGRLKGDNAKVSPSVEQGTEADNFRHLHTLNYYIIVTCTRKELEIGNQEQLGCTRLDLRILLSKDRAL